MMGDMRRDKQEPWELCYSIEAPRVIQNRIIKFGIFRKYFYSYCYNQGL